MYTRKHFLSFPGKNVQQVMQEMCLGVNSDICRATALGHTALLYQHQFAPGQANMTRAELVETFQRKFPHCLVEGLELNRGILIDWS